MGSPKTGAGADLSKAIVASHEAAQSTSGAAVPERAKAHRRVLLLPDEARVVGSGPGADVQRFVAACLVLARSPAADISADTAFEVQSPGKEPSDGAREDVSRDLRRSTTEEASLAGASKKPEPGSDPSRRDEAPRPRDSQAPTPPTREAAVRVEGPARPSNEAESHRVEAGGLLFLVRWIARSAWLDEHRSEALSQRLAAFGAIAVDRVLSPLPPASKQNVFYRQWPLVQVFSALRGEPPPGAFSGAETVLAEIGITDGEVLSDAARLVDEVASEIPPDLALFEGGVRAVFGARERPFAASDPTERLAALMLRPGRLSVSAHRAELTLPARSVDVALRIGGWDIDPGFVPYLGRVIRFVYEEPLP